jgi:REase_DpnII-MboI
MTSKKVELLSKLIAKGELVLATHRPNPHVVGFPSLDSEAFEEWKALSLSSLISMFGESHIYVVTFREKVKERYQNTVRAGLGILKAAEQEFAAGLVGSHKDQDALLLIENICSQFHIVARQLRKRHGQRPTLDVQDEYDVQDLMHSLLRLHFHDIRSEEYAPSYAGKASRMDFLLKQELIVLELKKTRSTLQKDQLSTELIEDIQRYKAHPDCKTLVCFVYDPDQLIANPRGMEADLSREGNPFPVKVLIRP